MPLSSKNRSEAEEVRRAGRQTRWIGRIVFMVVAAGLTFGLGPDVGTAFFGGMSWGFLFAVWEIANDENERRRS